MKAVILLSVLAVAFASECGENEHFESCGTACPLTCENYQNPPKFCVLSCNIGCHCDKGYVRSADGRCVKPEECPAAAPKECGENQHYEECGTACELTCKNFDNPPKFCVKMCKSGCFCDKGFVKTEDGECVRPLQCPEQAVCGENQRYLECGTACPLTCDNYDNPPKICPAMCLVGCHCEPGYVKTRDGRCVRPEDCPSKSKEQCKIDEQYYPDIPDCRNACENYNDPAPICPQYFVPRPGCFCKEGLWKRKDGKCVIPENCFPQDAALELCQLPAKTGMCRGYFPRYFYNQETGKCEEFIYGGCGGNENNFNTLEECHSICGSS